MQICLYNEEQQLELRTDHNAQDNAFPNQALTAELQATMHANNPFVQRFLQAHEMNPQGTDNLKVNE